MGAGDMTEPADVALVQAFTTDVGLLLDSLRGRPLTPADRATLQAIVALLDDRQIAAVFIVETSEGAALRRAWDTAGGRA